MASWVTVTLAVWISCLKVLSPFLWGKLSMWMTMNTSLSTRRGLGRLKVDLWSDGFSWTYQNPPKSSRPRLTDATSHHQSWEHSSEEQRLAGLAHSVCLAPAEPQVRTWSGHHCPKGFWQPGPFKTPMFTSLSSPGPSKSPYFNCFKYFPSNDGYIKSVRKIFLKGKQSQNYSLGPQFRNKINLHF